jgi:hypothetical protein
MGIDRLVQKFNLERCLLVSLLSYKVASFGCLHKRLDWLHRILTVSIPPVPYFGMR